MTSVIAHRGVSEAYPAGGLDGYREARNQGADWVTIEVRRTADDVLVVATDAHLGDGRLVAEMTAAELPPDLPLLITVLEACTGMGATVVIRNDPDDPGYDADHRISESVAGLLLSREVEDPVVAASANLESLARIKALAPVIETAWTSFDIPDLGQAVERCVAGGHSGLHAHVSYVNRGLVQRAHERSLRIHAWTVDDPVRMEELVRWGVDGIVTTKPELARRVVDATESRAESAETPS